MEMTHKTSCALCSINCGLEVLVENNHMVKIRPDKDNPLSHGYACRKGLNISFHQHNADIPPSDMSILAGSGPMV
jgi:anaerobic selenocysteine-containing dehydrogenase